MFKSYYTVTDITYKNKLFITTFFEHYKLQILFLLVFRNDLQLDFNTRGTQYIILHFLVQFFGYVHNCWVPVLSQYAFCFERLTSKSKANLYCWYEVYIIQTWELENTKYFCCSCNLIVLIKFK